MRVDWAEHQYADEGEAEVSDPGEQAVELGLVLDQAGQGGRSVVLVGQVEIVEPGRPVRVEPFADAELVAEPACVVGLGVPSGSDR